MPKYQITYARKRGDKRQHVIVSSNSEFNAQKKVVRQLGFVPDVLRSKKIVDNRKPITAKTKSRKSRKSRSSKVGVFGSLFDWI